MLETKEQVRGFLPPPSEKQLEALVRLEGNEDFRRIQAWFLEAATSVDRVLRNAEPAVTIYRAQGAQGVLLTFCDYAAAPTEYATRIRMQKAGYRPPAQGFTDHS